MERLKVHADNIIDLTRDTDNDGLYLGLEHVEGWTGRLALDESDPAFESLGKRFQAGDVLFGKLRPYLAK